MAAVAHADDRTTRERLLSAACEVFAEKGYRDATISQISERAGANIAAVNYYFHDKEALYIEAWRQAFERSLKAHPPEGVVVAEASAEERLRGRILAIVRRIVDPESHEFDIVNKEFANPTGLLAKVMRECIDPLRRGLDEIVRELLGGNASDKQVRLCGMSIMAQCLRLMMSERHRKRVAAQAEGETQTPDFTVEEIADHIARFSLAGIRGVRQEIESTEAGREA